MKTGGGVLTEEELVSEITTRLPSLKRKPFTVKFS